MAGFLNSTDLRLAYRAAVPYISNPFVTMALTSVQVVRRYIPSIKFILFLKLFLYFRFTAFGGPSLYMSFLGMEMLYGPVKVNMTFDPNLDWSNSMPELLYWDNSM